MDFGQLTALRMATHRGATLTHSGKGARSDRGEAKIDKHNFLLLLGARFERLRRQRRHRLVRHEFVFLFSASIFFRSRLV